MANLFIFCLLLLRFHVESCFIPRTLHVNAPQTIPVGYEVTRVEVTNCDTEPNLVSVSDPSFQVLGDGAVVARRPVRVAPTGRTFSVLVQDNRGLQSKMEVHLVHNRIQKRQYSGKDLLRRTKRRWSPPPFNILENDAGPFPRDIEELVSDASAKYDVYYEISGPGYNQYPVGVFGFDGNTGMLSLLKPVDREMFPNFILTAKVFKKGTREETDLPLDIHVNVDDVNDNAPQFQGSLQFTVAEHSSAGTVVGQVNATDKDDPKTDHVKIKYSLLSETDKFAVDPKTGVITTVTNTLDREVKDEYSVVVEIKDRMGAAGGLATTATATISVTDINDHPPTFTEASYDVSVKENENEKLLLRIPVQDKDLVNTPNWISKFVITKGNEKGNFRMDTDAETNEGLLYVSKPLNYEETKKVDLEIQARNEADLSGTQAKWLSIPVGVNVADDDEGPEFTAPTVRFTVKENIPNGTLIGSYTAVDPETKSSEGIRYYKVTDPGSWISVDRNTGELRVANTIDRESQFCKNGIYNITMKAVDASTKSGMGTVILQVDDVNDNIPKLPAGEQLLCHKEGEFGSVLVTAEDLDQSPFSAPFTFSLPKDHDGKWSVASFNDTTATLQQLKYLPTGIHEVQVDVADLQGHGETQTVKVQLCQCRNGACLTKPLSASLGPLGWLTLLLPLALLLLLFLLLAFFCVTKGDHMQLEDTGDSGGILLKSNTEAPGEEVDSSLITVPTTDSITKGSVKGSLLNTGWSGAKGAGTIQSHDILDRGMYKSTTNGMQEFYSGQYDSQYGGHLLGTLSNRQLAQDTTFLHNWQTNGRYLQQKLGFFGTEEEGRYADDIVHSYGFEGVGSSAGSLGCCSDYANSENLDFLNTLGPKFKTLAGVSKKT